MQQGLCVLSVVLYSWTRLTCVYVLFLLFLIYQNIKVQASSTHSVLSRREDTVCHEFNYIKSCTRLLDVTPNGAQRKLFENLNSCTTCWPTQLIFDETRKKQIVIKFWSIKCFEALIRHLLNLSLCHILSWFIITSSQVKLWMFFCHIVGTDWKTSR